MIPERIAACLKLAYVDSIEESEIVVYMTRCVQFSASEHTNDAFGIMLFTFDTQRVTATKRGFGARMEQSHEDLPVV